MASVVARHRSSVRLPDFNKGACRMRVRQVHSALVDIPCLSSSQSWIIHVPERQPRADRQAGLLAVGRICECSSRRCSLKLS